MSNLNENARRVAQAARCTTSLSTCAAIGFFVAAAAVASAPTASASEPSPLGAESALSNGRGAVSEATGGEHAGGTLYADELAAVLAELSERDAAELDAGDLDAGDLDAGDTFAEIVERAAQVAAEAASEDLSAATTLETAAEEETAEEILSPVRQRAFDGRALPADVIAPALPSVARIDIEAETETASPRTASEARELDAAREAKLDGGAIAGEGGSEIETATVAPRGVTGRGGALELDAAREAKLDGGSIKREGDARIETETVFGGDERVEEREPRFETDEAAKAAAVELLSTLEPTALGQEESAETGASGPMANGAEGDVFAAIVSAGAPIDHESAMLDPISSAEAEAEAAFDPAAAPIDHEASALDAQLGERSPRAATESDAAAAPIDHEAAALAPQLGAQAPRETSERDAASAPIDQEAAALDGGVSGSDDVSQRAPL